MEQDNTTIRIYWDQTFRFINFSRFIDFIKCKMQEERKGNNSQAKREF